MERRILALWWPRLPTDRLTRKSPEAYRDKPLVIAGRAGSALHVQALNLRAQRQGLFRGQPLANARAMLQRLTVLPADEKADALLLDDIADWCDRFTPLVTLDAPDGLLLDITGAAHLFGGEQRMLELVRAKILEQGFSVQAAIAGTSLAARALARFAPGHIAAPNGEAEAMAPLPIAALDCGEEKLRALKRAGLKTIGDVATRGRAELAARLGVAFITRLNVMLGEEEKPLDPRRPQPDLCAERNFAEPVTTADVIAQSLHGLAQSVSEILTRQGKGVRMLEAAFFRADGKVVRIAVKTGAPLRDADVMLRLLNQKLEGLADPLDPGFGFDLIRLEALLWEETQTRDASLDADENAGWQVNFLLDRLSARFGESRVQRFVAQDTHIPEAESVAVPAQERDFTQPWTARRGHNDPPLRPLRLLERPEEINVPASEVPDGAPRRFRWRRAEFDVAHAEGPERIGMEWWRENPHQRLMPNPEKLRRIKLGLLPRSAPPSRDYFRIETRNGQRFWLYRDSQHLQNGLAPRWYLHGIFA